MKAGLRGAAIGAHSTRSRRLSRVGQPLEWGMGRVWVAVVLAAFAAFAADARADRAPYACGHGRSRPIIIVTKTEITHVGGAILYRGTHEVDTTPPAPPQVEATFVIGNEPVGDLARRRLRLVNFHGVVDADTVYLGAEITDAAGTQFFPATPNEPLYRPALALVPGPASVRVRAIDAAGNASAPVDLTSEVVIDADLPDPCDSKDSTSGMFLLVSAIVAFVLGHVIVLRVRRPQTPGEPLSHLVAEVVARAVWRRRLLATGLGIAAALALHALADDDSAIVLAIVPFTHLVQLLAAHHIVRRLEHGETVAERRDSYLYVAGEYLPASARIFDAARCHNLPRVEQR